MKVRKGPKNPKRVTAHGCSLTIAEWAESLGCKVQTIYARLYRGCSPDEAISAVVTDGRFEAVHGMSSSPEFRAWLSMKIRCGDETNHRYGGRGISVCVRWSSSFQAFIDSMGRRPSPEHSIDRINVHGGYTCGKCIECLANNNICNCRWATRVEQQRNRHDTRLLTYRGKTKPLLEWAEIYQVPPETVQRRLDRGWEVGRALTSPIETKHRRKQ